MSWFYALEISFLAALQVGAAVVLADLTRDKIQVWKEVNEGLIERIEVIVYKYAHQARMTKCSLYCAERWREEENAQQRCQRRCCIKEHRPESEQMNPS